MVKSEKYEQFFFVSKLPNWHQKWVAGIREGNLILVHQVLPTKNSCVNLIKILYAIPHQIEPGILKLTIKRGQSNISALSLFLFFSCEENGYYSVVLVGKHSFDFVGSAAVCKGYAYQPKLPGGWVLNLTLSTLSREMNVLLLYHKWPAWQAVESGEPRPCQVRDEKKAMGTRMTM